MLGGTGYEKGLLLSLMLEINRLKYDSCLAQALLEILSPRTFENVMSFSFFYSLVRK